MPELGFLLRATLGFLAGVIIIRSGRRSAVRGIKPLDGGEIRGDREIEAEV